MRNTYTCIFRNVTTSRIWALPPSARCVWLWLHLVADPEGFVCATVSGVAVGANVPVEDARMTLERLEAPDPDADPSDPFEGRVVKRVPRGWLVLGFEELRELAKEETRRARNRKYMKGYRAANDNASTSGLEGDTVSPPKPRPKPNDLSEEINPPTPQGSVAVALTQLPELWEPSDELRSSAIAAGVAKLDEHIKRLRTGPIGGARGVFPSQLENYIGGLFGTWRTWEETDRAKAAQKNSGQRGSPFRPTIDPTGKHRRFAAKHGLDLDALVRELTESRVHEELGQQRALEILGERMSKMVREKEAAA